MLGHICLSYVLNELADDMRLIERYNEPIQVYLKITWG